MKSTLKFLSATALLSLASSLVLTGCPGEVDTCTTDADCDTGYICDADVNECVLEADACTSNADCADGTFCVQEANNSGDFVCGMPTDCSEIALEEEKDSYCDTQEAGAACLPIVDGGEGAVECRVPTNCGEATDVDTYCRNELGLTDDDGVACDVVDGETPTCVATVMTDHYHVMVKDISTEDCNLAEDANGFDPGSDITFVELTDADAMVLGYGKTVTYTQGNDPADQQNDFTNTDVLDGAAPDLLTESDFEEDLENRCPAGDSAGRFSTTSVLTLGCSGSVIVDFPTAASLQPIFNGQTVTVGEYAPVCNQNENPTGTTGTTDFYEVYVCPAVEVDGTAPTDLDCEMSGVKISTDTTAGLKSYEVTGVKDAPAADDSGEES